jgi:hypothetical protein
MEKSPLKDPEALAVLERVQRVKEQTYALQQLWLVLDICHCEPSAAQFAIWLTRHPTKRVEAAFEATAAWLSKLRGDKISQAVVENRKAQTDNPTSITHDQKIRYASGVMVRMGRES